MSQDLLMMPVPAPAPPLRAGAGPRRGLAIISCEEGRQRIVFASESLSDWSDAPLAALVDQPPSRLVQPADAIVFERALAAAAQGAPQTGLLLHAAGSAARSAWVSVRAVDADGGAPAVTVLFEAGPTAPDLSQAAAPLLPAGPAWSELRLLFQPIVDLADGRVLWLEALLRWQRRDGLAGPETFLPQLEDSGRMRELSLWTIRSACAALRRWEDGGNALARVTLNVSAAQLLDPQLPRHLEDALAEFGVAPQRLAIEVSEALLASACERVVGALQPLRAMGIGVLLDDFGTGVSSLAHLQAFPFDQLKIHQSLVQAIAGPDPAEPAAATVLALLDLGHRLGMTVVAEGVETDAQFAFLAAAGCDALQGYLLSGAVPADTVPAWQGRLALPAGPVRRPRTLLLVDDEANVLSALKRLLRPDGYRILTAPGGAEALALLAHTAADVIVSDQRMPGMSGSEFLQAAAERYPSTVRIMLSGYTDLQSVTDSVNSGAIYKFLTKPWDDAQLREHIAAAFRIKGIADENQVLSQALHRANRELAQANREMEGLMRRMREQISSEEAMLCVAFELLECMPLPVLGIDLDGVVAFANSAACRVFEGRGPLLGSETRHVLPELAAADADTVSVGGKRYAVERHTMGARSGSRGTLVTMRRLYEVDP
jgi:EAL domain-containing protein (putative c-di-GMP-specific phosphodiesterase class I)/FixJ family two-component response regulator